MSKEDELVEKLEAIGSKTVKVIEKTYIKNEPKLFKLLDAFEKWLDKKLS